MVRVPSSARVGMTWRIAGWCIGAIMKPMPQVSSAFSTASAPIITLMPSWVSASAAPDFDDRLRLPCLATDDARAGDDEGRRGRDVERALAVAAGADDVHRPFGRAHRVAFRAHHARRRRRSPRPSRRGCAAPSASRPSAPGVAAPSNRVSKARSASARVSGPVGGQADQRAQVVAHAGTAAAPGAFEEIPQHLVAMFGGDRFRGGTARPRSARSRWRRPMIVPSSSQAVTSRQSGRRVAVDDQRMIARGLEGRGQAREDALAGVMHRAHLAMHDLVAAHDLAAEGLADRLVAEADAEQRCPVSAAAAVRARQMPA